jgi:GT2 family glycosyltransferase
MKSPICIFLYNRPEHTLTALRTLQVAEGALDSPLFIFCDGSKEDASIEEREKVKRVREIADEINGFKEIKIIKQSSNIGLANSIIMGVTQVIEEFGKVIVIEDDHLVHKDFLKYMNFYLNEYENDERVMHVGAFARNSYLQFFLDRVYFTRFMDCWGWATWISSWKLLITDFNIIDLKLGDRSFLVSLIFQN